MTHLSNFAPDINGLLTGMPPARIFPPLAIEDDRLETRIDDLTVKLAQFTPAEFPEDACLPDAEPASFPDRRGLIYTARLRALMPIFIAQLFSMFSVKHIQRGAAARLQELRCALQVLYKTDTQNYIISATQAMQDCPRWQAQVREDLGGEAALQKWEQRQARSKEANPDLQERFRPLRPLQTISPRKPSRNLTDRTGLFKLAAITRETQSPATSQNSTPRAAWQFALSFREPPAIGVTPDQLRPALQKPAGDALAYERLLEIWQAMQSDHDESNHLLMIADLMRGSQALREEYAPP